MANGTHANCKLQFLCLPNSIDAADFHGIYPLRFAVKVVINEYVQFMYTINVQ